MQFWAIRHLEVFDTQDFAVVRQLKNGDFAACF